MLILGGCIGRGALVALAAFQIPSWYNVRPEVGPAEPVLAAFQIPSWYNDNENLRELVVVLAAFQIPSWYNVYRRL